MAWRLLTVNDGLWWPTGTLLSTRYAGTGDAMHLGVSCWYEAEHLVYKLTRVCGGWHVAADGVCIGNVRLG